MTAGTPTFSTTDAATLRATQPSYASESSAEAPPELQRYLHHYGFQQLLALNVPVTHRLHFHTWHGYNVALHAWQRESARGTVVVVHGLFDHVGLYLKLVKHLLSEGYNVVGFDLPGHGLSGGKRVSIKNFSDYTAVLRGCIDWCQDEMPGPVHLVGQSTGCSAIMYLLIKESERQSTQAATTAPVAKAVLLAPLVRARAWGRVTLAHSLLGWMISKVPRQFGANSHDPAFLRFLYRHDPLQARHIAVLWVGAMRTWVKTFQAAPTTPGQVLIIQGTGDNTVDWHWNLPAIHGKFPQARVHYVEGALHHLVNEANPWRNDVFRTLSNFLAQ